MNIYILLIISFIARFLLAILFPLTADEAYYWLWSKHLSLSFVDHPPMVAYINYLFTLGQENLALVRLGAVLITTLVTGLIYLVAKEVYNEKVAFWSALLFQVLPHFVVVWLTQFVELPLALFWMTSLWLTLKIVKEGKAYYWYFLAVVLGLGYLSKYTMFLFWPCLLFYAWIAPEGRFWLKRKEPYLALAISLLFFAPVLFWNSQHAWVSFAFHGSKVSGDPWGANTLAFIADQLVHFTPFLIFTLIPVFRQSSHGDKTTKLLVALSFPVLCLFLLLSLKVKIWAHWPSVGYLAALPLTVNYLLVNGKSLKKFLTWIALFTSLILLILFFVSPAILLHQEDYAKNYSLTKNVPAEYKLFAKTNVSASLLEFHTKRPTYLATGFLMTGHPWGEKQYEIWGIPELKKGETVLYYGPDNEVFREQANKHFTKTSELSDLKMYLVEDYITNNYKMFKLEGYKLDGFHP
ncbi:MAG: glycosyltransferase family 39 protein [Candidatus Margulisiibacteriota bacterium]